MTTTAQSQAPLLEMKDITKSFPGSKALLGANLKVNNSEVHALVGQNGAGKSTLIKILTGAYRRDEGSVTFNGREIDFTSPQTAQNAGISTIYQEVNLVPLRTVTENIFLGREKKRFGLLQWRKMNLEATELLERFDVHIDVTQPLGSYNIAVQQMVAIARAVSVNAKLVVMDEPTSSLDEREVEVLFNVIRQLKRDGVSVIFITHRLDELYVVCDRITILRDGRTVFEGAIKDLGKLELVSRMVGKKLDEVVAAGQTAFEKRDAVMAKSLLEATHLARKPRIRDVSVSVKSGEIVGMAGLLGAGRTETARLIFGADSKEQGTLRFEGRDVNFRSPADAIKAGLGFCSEDRKVEGIIPQMSVQENLTLALLPLLAKAGVVDTAKQEEVVKTFIQKLGIKTAGPHQPIRELSGGNQQKVLLARWLCMNPKLLILDEPTRGIDVGAKAEIQKLINELAEQGLGVLMISSELEELSEGCDAVVVLRDGKSIANLAENQISEEAMMNAMATGLVQESIQESSHAS
jgi:galactofuranose transport system ATP-binding protein